MKVKTTEILPFGALVEPLGINRDLEQVDIGELKELLQNNHLIIIRGFHNFSNKDEFTDYCELWGEISLWPFGKVLELVEQEKPEDHIFDHNYVPLHWDGMYRPQVPELQIFHCVHSPGTKQGGRTTFSNTTMAYNQASVHKRNLWSRVTGVYERRMEFYHSKTTAPIVTEHPSRGYPVIRYCEPPQSNDKSFLNHPKYEFTGLQQHELAEFMSSLKDSLYSPQNFYAHEWQTGDIVISDNHTLLHGREAFTSGAPRHLRRVHVLGETLINNPHLVFHS